MQWPVPAGKPRQQPDAVLMLAGAIHQMRGRVSVLRGTLFHNDILRARGQRQQLVGLLQRFWRRDRLTVEAWVDAALRKHIAPPSITKASWRNRPRPHTPLLQQES
jgi:hypothetical protein